MADWFSHGERVADGVRDENLYPPLGDRDAQRQWLGGFGAAWAACAEDQAVDEALVEVLDGRPELLAELWAIGLGRIKRRAH